MTYVELINRLIADAVAGNQRLVVYGQNIAAGSCLSGLTRGLKEIAPDRVFNTPNAENALVGLGFGLMLRGVDALFCMKQQDFLLLGIDQLVNSWNLLRRQRPAASFTVLATIVDSGYEGPQASLNNLADFCSIGRLPGYTVCGRDDAEALLPAQLSTPGFRLIGVGQRLFRTAPLSFDGAAAGFGGGAIFRYCSGKDLTIACANLSLPQGAALRETLAARGVSASLFSLNAAMPVDWTPVLQDLARTGRLALLDDGKSVNKPYAGLHAAALSLCGPQAVHVLARGSDDAGLSPNPDRFEVDGTALAAGLGL